MALAISNVPALTSEVADCFVKETEYNAKNLAGSKYDADAQAKCLSIVERSRRFLKKMKGNDAE